MKGIKFKIFKINTSIKGKLKISTEKWAVIKTTLTPTHTTQLYERCWGTERF